ncbi:MAG TPA: VWA domain-containing protein [Pyrinomonadaceae bacterium]|nr:VWA domain-containing protein [Pyrinomonadaceae bacterium]
MAIPGRNNPNPFLLKPCIVGIFLIAAIYAFAPASPGQKRKSNTQPKPSPAPNSELQRVGPPPAAPILQKREQDVGPSEVISVDTTEVMLPVTVRDGSGRLVADLKRDDFHVFEDDREERLSELALRQVPVDVILMVDSSSSVAENLDDFRKAAMEFAAQLDDKDRISLIKFDDRVQLLQEWTQSRFQFQRALNRIEPGMFTRLNDALVLAAREQFGNTQSRRAIILLTDGVDSGRGASTAEQALEAVLNAQASVYVVSNGEISRVEKQSQLNALLNSDSVTFNQMRIDDLREGLRALDESEVKLTRLADATGGRIYKPASFARLNDAYREVAEELRHQYAIYYTPSNKTHDGSFRHVRVVTRNPQYRTSTRIGYYAPQR